MFSQEQMRRKAAAFAACTAVATLAAASVGGCGNQAAKDDAEMRKAMTKKNWSINDVPPEQRAKVQALMQQNGARPR